MSGHDYQKRVIVDPPGELLTPGEAARMFGVEARTVTRWAKAGRIRFLRTLGGHRRYRREDLERLLRGPA